MNIFNIDPKWIESRSYITETVVRHHLFFAHMSSVDVAVIHQDSSYLKAFTISIKAPGIEKSRGVTMEVHRETMSEGATLSEAKHRAEALCRFFYGDECFAVKVP